VKRIARLWQRREVHNVLDQLAPILMATQTLNAGAMLVAFRLRVRERTMERWGQIVLLPLLGAVTLVLTLRVFV
jgi:hypothetical protein